MPTALSWNRRTKGPGGRRWRWERMTASSSVGEGRAVRPALAQTGKEDPGGRQAAEQTPGRCRRHRAPPWGRKGPCRVAGSTPGREVNAGADLDTVQDKARGRERKRGSPVSRADGIAGRRG